MLDATADPTRRGCIETAAEQHNSQTNCRPGRTDGSTETGVILLFPPYSLLHLIKTIGSALNAAVNQGAMSTLLNLSQCFFTKKLLFILLSLVLPST